MNDEKINVIISPKGYGKCYKEYKDVIDYLENKINILESNRDKAIDFIKHIKAILKEYNYEPYRVNTALDDILRMLGVEDGKNIN